MPNKKNSQPALDTQDEDIFGLGEVGHIGDMGHEANDASFDALEVLLSAQQRMKGIVECATALNRLMAEAASKDNMPFPIPILPPGFFKNLQNGAAGLASTMRGAGRAESESVSSSSETSSLPTSKEAYQRLEDLIKGRGFISNEDVREVFGLSPVQATLRLKTLVADRVLLQRGQRRGARYVAGPRWPPRS